jgi:hypothetical protein
MDEHIITKILFKLQTKGTQRKRTAQDEMERRIPLKME